MSPDVLSSLVTVIVSDVNCYGFLSQYNLKSASSSFGLPMFVVFPEFCEQAHTHNMITIPFCLHFTARLIMVNQLIIFIIFSLLSIDGILILILTLIDVITLQLISFNIHCHSSSFCK